MSRATFNVLVLLPFAFVALAFALPQSHLARLVPIAPAFVAAATLSLGLLNTATHRQPALSYVGLGLWHALWTAALLCLLRFLSTSSQS